MSDKAQYQASETHVGRTSSREETDQASYWDEIYASSENNSPGWNLGEVNPEFIWQLQHAQPKFVPGRVLVLGAGYGHDAAYLAKQGFEVCAVDMSDWAVRGARQTFEQAGVEVELLHSDIFALDSSYNGRFDYVLEHTCFCAIHPERRSDYRDLVYRVLKPGGQLFGLFYFHQKEGGPPFNTTPDEVRDAFAKGFRIETLAMAEHNVEKRRGKELWARFWKEEA
ncbi:MAG: methyltransferase domain-containing protein [Planctomycetes bacterium]|nr:methyltransferase domain-containing protein [Planctomycetota bacterium]